MNSTVCTPPTRRGERLRCLPPLSNRSAQVPLWAEPLQAKFSGEPTAMASLMVSVAMRPSINIAGCSPRCLLKALIHFAAALMVLTSRSITSCALMWSSPSTLTTLTMPSIPSASHMRPRNCIIFVVGGPSHQRFTRVVLLPARPSTAPAWCNWNSWYLLSCTVTISLSGVVCQLDFCIIVLNRCKCQMYI